MDKFEDHEGGRAASHLISWLLVVPLIMSIIGLCRGVYAYRDPTTRPCWAGTLLQCTCQEGQPQLSQRIGRRAPTSSVGEAPHRYLLCAGICDGDEGSPRSIGRRQPAPRVLRPEQQTSARSASTARDAAAGASSGAQVAIDVAGKARDATVSGASAAKEAAANTAATVKDAAEGAAKMAKETSQLRRRENGRSEGHKHGCCWRGQGSSAHRHWSCARLCCQRCQQRGIKVKDSQRAAHPQPTRWLRVAPPRQRV